MIRKTLVTTGIKRAASRKVVKPPSDINKNGSACNRLLFQCSPVQFWSNHRAVDVMDATRTWERDDWEGSLALARTIYKCHQLCREAFIRSRYARSTEQRHLVRSVIRRQRLRGASYI